MSLPHAAVAPLQRAWRLLAELGQGPRSDRARAPRRKPLPAAAWPRPRDPFHRGRAQKHRQRPERQDPQLPKPTFAFSSHPLRSVADPLSNSRADQVNICSCNANRRDQTIIRHLFALRHHVFETAFRPTFGQAPALLPAGPGEVGSARRSGTRRGVDLKDLVDAALGNDPAFAQHDGPIAVLPENAAVM